jgi:hypothetical protein
MRRYKPAAQRHLQQPFSYWHISLCPHCSLLFIDIALVLSKDDLMSRSSSFSGRVNFTVKMEAPLRSVEARQESFPAVIASGVCITRLFNRRSASVTSSVARNHRAASACFMRPTLREPRIRRCVGHVDVKAQKQSVAPFASAPNDLDGSPWGWTLLAAVIEASSMDPWTAKQASWKHESIKSKAKTSITARGVCRYRRSR